MVAMFASPIKAATYTVDSASDIIFEISETQQFTARAYAQQYGIDSMLWLYNSQNQELISNDDYFGLDSFISIQLNPGSYRLRTGVCCGDPNRWYGASYLVETSLTGVLQGSTTTTSSSTTTSSTSTTSTTVQLYLNSPRNLRISNRTYNSISLDWDAPVESNLEVERYAIFWSCDNWQTGYAISSITTNATIYNLNSDTQCEFKVRADNDAQSVYSNFTETLPATTNTTTTTSATTTTSTSTSSTTTSTTTTIVQETTTIVALPETTTTLETTTTSSTTTIPPAITSTTVFVTPATTTTSSTTSTTSTTTSTTIPPTTTSTQQTTTTTALVIEENMSQNELVKAVTNAEILQEISKDEAVQIFESLDTSQITDQEKEIIIDAIQDAPSEVKEAFEQEINIYGEGFDNYVPVGSSISVKERRTLLAVAGIASTMSVVPASSGGAGNGSGGSSGNSNPKNPSDSNTAFKKDEEAEEEEEEAPEIEGPEGGDDEDFTKNSIFKYGEDGMKRFSIWNFIKKFSKETAALAFTISSTVIVFATLSGDTRKITLIATTCAFLVHYISVMLSNDE